MEDFLLFFRAWATIREAQEAELMPNEKKIDFIASFLSAMPPYLSHQMIQTAILIHEHHVTSGLDGIKIYFRPTSELVTGSTEVHPRITAIKERAKKASDSNEENNN